MKTPLHYQMTEYDCGPISMMNAIIFLFDREQIPPDLIRNIMLYCLDGYGAEGAPGRSGTTRAAMMFLSNFLGSFGRTGQLDLSRTAPSPTVCAAAARWSCGCICSTTRITSS